jgi:hypothetical protein
MEPNLVENQNAKWYITTMAKARVVALRAEVTLLSAAGHFCNVERDYKYLVAIQCYVSRGCEVVLESYENTATKTHNLVVRGYFRQPLATRTALSVVVVTCVKLVVEVIYNVFCDIFNDCFKRTRTLHQVVFEA